MNPLTYPGLMKYAPFIRFICRDKNVADFGGCENTLDVSANIFIVDMKSEYHSTTDVPVKLDIIFSSHTLEHVDDLENTIDEFYRSLTDGGLLILHVPDWRYFGWWSHKFQHDHASGSSHKRIFKLTTDYIYHKDIEGGSLDTVVAIDQVIADKFTVLICEHVEFDSIFILAQKGGTDEFMYHTC